MKAMSYIDLPNFLYNMDGGADLTLVGLLTGYIEPPYSLSSLTYKKGTKLGKLEVLGVKVHINLGDGKEEVTEYLCKGVVPILLDEYIQIQYSKKPSGKLGVTLRGKVTLARGNKKNRKSTIEDNLVVGFRRYVDSSNVWCAIPFHTTLISKERDPYYYSLLLKASENNWDLHAETESKIHANYICAGEGITFELLGVGNVRSNVANTKLIDPDILDTSKVSKGSLGTENKASNKGVTLDSKVVSDDDISILLKNRVKEESKIVNRLSVVPKSGSLKELSTLINKSTKKVDKIVMDIQNIPKSEWSDAIEYMALGLSQLWNSVGKALFVGTLVKLYPKEESKILLIESVLGGDFALKWGDNEIIEDYENLSNLIINTKELIYIHIVDTVLKLKGNLVNMYFNCRELDVCILTLMHRNPYYLGLIDTSLSVEEIDLIAILFNVDMNDKTLRLRNAVIGHLYMLNNKNRGVGSNSLMKYGYLYYNLQSGKILNKYMYDLLVTTGSIITEDQIKVSKRLFAPTLKEELLKDNVDGYVETIVGGIKKYVKTSESSATIIDDYVNSGLGIKVIQDGVAYICDYVLAEMEMYIYEKLHSMASKKINKLNVESTKLVSEFEYNKSKEFGVDFKLEDMQKKATELANLNCGCLTGCAGSGKTTTAELLLYSIDRGGRLKRDDIVFVAPTGKASVRLREVVKRKTSTIHSYFGIKGESYSIFNRYKTEEVVDAKVVIADEMSMVNTSLMYNMLKKIGDSTRLYLIGDMEQLTPIGFGKPFVNAMYYLPTVVLDVNKRALSGSGIALNSDNLLKTDKEFKPLVETDDFKIVDVKSDDIEETIVNICSYHIGADANINSVNLISNIGKISIDEIQVVTPLNKGSWGTKNLNRRLQKLFNPRAKVSVVNRRGTESEITFKVGDRVIHTENHPDTVRLEDLGNGTYKKLKEDLQNGVMNGDVGKVVAIHYGKDIKFIGDKKLYEQYSCTDSTYYLVVEYEDIDSDTAKPIKYSILYGFESGNHTNHMEAKLKGNSLGVLDLAYALTVHKLQGSQAKLVIFAIDKVGRKGFISRNMLYTGITRSKEGCYLIGNVSGGTSAVSEGRKIQQCDYILTTLDKII